MSRACQNESVLLRGRIAIITAAECLEPPGHVMCHCSIWGPDTWMVCTLGGIYVTCQSRTCRHFSQLYSSEVDWKRVCSYTLEKAVEWIINWKKSNCTSVKKEDLFVLWKWVLYRHCLAHLYLSLLCCFSRGFEIGSWTARIMPCTILAKYHNVIV